MSSERHKPAAMIGGTRLRMLREQVGMTQLVVEADAGIGTGYMQRIESGKVRQPDRSTLERILAALGAGYSDRREVLALFGYMLATPLPSDDEIAWARHVCARELRDATFPAYVLDCAHRLLAWNRFVPRVLRCIADEPERARRERWSMLSVWFNADFGVGALVQNPDTFFAHMIRALQHEMQLFGNEPWYTELIDRLLAESALFRSYWQRRASAPPYVAAARALVPMQLALPSIGRLQFRLAAERFTTDARFRIVYFLPADAPTIQQCAVWARDP